MVDLGTKIGEMVKRLFEDDSLFLVEVEVKGNASHPRVTVKIDGDNGVSIDACAQMSRKLGNEIEVEGLIDTAYNLEVSSPGLDQPIKERRQFIKNIGRKVKVVLNDGKDSKGELLEVMEDGIRINAEKRMKNKKNKKYEEQVIAFGEIKTTNILVSFK